MEKDQWKEFIDDHRETFDADAPGDHVWNNVENYLRSREPKMVKLSLVLRIAAVFVIVFGAAITWLMIRPVNNAPLAEHKLQNEDMVLTQVSPEHAEMELFYVSRINSAMSELDNYKPDPEMVRAIEDLDREFNELKKELNGPVNREEIVEAMIENYRFKLDLLEQMLESLKEETNANGENYTTI